MLNLRRRMDASKVFLISGVPSEERKDIAKKIHQLGGKYFEIEIFKAHCSHVICGRLSRSEKLLGALSTGKWVLHPEFVHQSAVANTWLDEEQFEWCDENIRRVVPSVPMEMALATRRWRFLLAGVGSSFSGWKVAILMSAKRNATLKRLLVSGGAEVYTLKFPIKNPEKVANSIGYVFVSESNVAAVSHLFDYGVLCVQPEFIANYLIKDPPADPMDYLVQRVDPGSATPSSPTDAGSQSFLLSSQQSFLSSTTTSPFKSVTDSPITRVTAAPSTTNGKSSATSPPQHITLSPIVPVTTRSAVSNAKSATTSPPKRVPLSPIVPVTARSSATNVKSTPAPPFKSLTDSQIVLVTATNSAPVARSRTTTLPWDTFNILQPGPSGAANTDLLTNVLYATASPVVHQSRADRVMSSTPADASATAVCAHSETTVEGDLPQIQSIKPLHTTVMSDVDNMDVPTSPDHTGATKDYTNTQSFTPIIAHLNHSTFTTYDSSPAIRRSSRQSRKSLPPKFVKVPLTANTINKQKRKVKTVPVKIPEIRSSSSRLQPEFSAIPNTQFQSDKQLGQSSEHLQNQRESNSHPKLVYSDMHQHVIQDNNVILAKKHKDSIAEKPFPNHSPLVKENVKLQTGVMEMKMDRKQRKADSMAKRVSKRLLIKAVNGSKSRKCSCCNSSPKKEPTMQFSQSHVHVVEMQTMTNKQMCSNYEELACEIELSHDNITVNDSSNVDDSNHKNLGTCAPVRLSKRLQSKGPKRIRKRCTSMCCRTPEKQSSCRNKQSQHLKVRLHTGNSSHSPSGTSESTLNIKMTENSNIELLNDKITANAINCETICSPGQLSNTDNVEAQDSKIKKLFDYKYTPPEKSNTLEIDVTQELSANNVNTETQNSKLEKLFKYKYMDTEKSNKGISFSETKQSANSKNRETPNAKIQKLCNYKFTDTGMVKNVEIQNTPVEQGNNLKKTDSQSAKLEKQKCSKLADQPPAMKKRGFVNKCTSDIRNFFNPIPRTESIEESTACSAAKTSSIDKEDTIDLCIIDSDTIMDKSEVNADLVQAELSEKQAVVPLSKPSESCINTDNSETIHSLPVAEWKSTEVIATLHTSLADEHPSAAELLDHSQGNKDIQIEMEQEFHPVECDDSTTREIDSSVFAAITTPVVGVRSAVVTDALNSPLLAQNDSQMSKTGGQSVDVVGVADDGMTVVGGYSAVDGEWGSVVGDVPQIQTPVARSTPGTHRQRDASTGKKRKSRHDVDLPTILRELKRQKISHCQWRPSMFSLNYRDNEVPVDSVEMSTTMTAIIQTHVDEEFTLSAIHELGASLSLKYYPQRATVECFIKQILLMAPSRLEAQQAYMVLMKLISLHPPTTPEIINLFRCCDWPFLKDILSDLIAGKGEDVALFTRMLLLRFIVGLLEQNLQHWLSETQKGSPIAASQNLLLCIMWSPSYHVVVNSRCQELLDFLAEILIYLPASDSPGMTPHFTELLDLVGWLVGMSAEVCRVSEFGPQAGTKCPQSAFVHELARRIMALGIDDKAILHGIFSSLKFAWLCVGICQQMLSQMDDYLLAGEQLKDDKGISLSTIVSRFFYLLPRLQGTEVKSTPSSQNPHSPSKVQRLAETCTHDVSQGQGQMKKIVSKAQKKNAKGETPLHTACIRGDPLKLKELLKVPGIDVNMRDNAGWTPLHEACNHGNIQCVQELLKFVPAKTMEHFFMKDTTPCQKVDILACTEEGITPLHDAVLNGRTEVARVLLQHGGSKLLLAKTCLSYTAMDLAETKELRSLLASHLPSNSQRSESQDFSSLSQESFTMAVEETRREMPCDLLYEQALGADDSRLYADRQSLHTYIYLVTVLLQYYAQATDLHRITEKIYTETDVAFDAHRQQRCGKSQPFDNGNEMKDGTKVDLQVKDVLFENAEVQKFEMQNGRKMVLDKCVKTHSNDKGIAHGSNQDVLRNHGGGDFLRRSLCNNNSEDVSVPKEEIREVRADLRVVRHLHKHVDMYRSHLLRLCRPEDDGSVETELLPLHCLVTGLQAVLPATWTFHP